MKNVKRYVTGNVISMVDPTVCLYIFVSGNPMRQRENPQKHAKDPKSPIPLSNKSK